MLVRLKRWFPWLLAGAFLGTSILFGVLWLRSEAKAERAEEVRAAATKLITALTNFSAATIDVDTAEIKSYGVGNFLDEAQTFFGEEAVAAIEEADASMEGTVESIFVQEIQGSDASVFGVAEVTIRNARVEEPQTDLVRLDIDMIETPDGWKATEVAVVDVPGATGPPPATP